MDLFIKPEKFINSLKYIRENHKIADFGCGSGFFTIALAKKAKNGKVFAIDILKEPLINLKKRAEILGIFNISYILSDLENIGGSMLEENSVDIVFVANILFQVEKKEVLIHEAYRILKKGGYIIILEYNKNFKNFGPPENLRLEKKDIIKLCNKIGFKLIEEKVPSESHFSLIFQK